MSADFASDGLDRLREMVRSGLVGWGFSPRSTVDLLTISENATFKAVCADTGRAIAVRIHRDNYHSQDEIRSELAWIAALRGERIVDTPSVITTREGTPVRRLTSSDGAVTRFAVAFEFVPGQEPNSTDDLPAWFFKLGQITARMHEHAKRWRSEVDFERKTWNFDLMFGAKPIWGPWQDGLGLDDNGRALLGRVVDTIQQRLKAFGDGPDRFGLIHADLRLANLLVDGETMRVIDFDDCGFSWFVYDFASAVSFIETDPIIPALAEAWVAGYRTVAPLPDQDAAEIPVFMMLRRILLVAWIATHSHSPMGGDVGIRYTRDSLTLADRFLTQFA